jgi:hypothetical protein
VSAVCCLLTVVCFLLSRACCIFLSFVLPPLPPSITFLPFPRLSAYHLTSIITRFRCTLSGENGDGDMLSASGGRSRSKESDYVHSQLGDTGLLSAVCYLLSAVSCLLSTLNWETSVFERIILRPYLSYSTLTPATLRHLATVYTNPNPQRWTIKIIL